MTTSAFECAVLTGRINKGSLGTVTNRQKHSLVRMQGNIISNKIKSAISSSNSIVRWQLLKWKWYFSLNGCSQFGLPDVWDLGKLYRQVSISPGNQTLLKDYDSRNSDSHKLIKGNVMTLKVHRLEDFSKNYVIWNGRLGSTCVGGISSREITRSTFWSSKQNLF